MNNYCYDCKYGFLDLVIPDWAWEKASPRQYLFILLLYRIIMYCQVIQDNN